MKVRRCRIGPERQGPTPPGGAAPPGATAVGPNRARTASTDCSTAARRAERTGSRANGSASDGPGPGESAATVSGSGSSKSRGCATVSAPSLLHRHAEQADAVVGGHAVEQPAGDLGDVGRQVGRVPQGARPGDRPEVAETDLELTVRPASRRGPQARRRRCRRVARPRARATRGRDVDRERLFVADRLRDPLGLDGARRRGSRRARGDGARARRRARATSASSGRRASSPTVRTPSSASRRRVAGPTPQRRSTASGCRNSSSCPARRRAGRRAWRGRSRAWPGTSCDATPTDAMSPVSSRTRVRISDRDLGPVPCRRRGTADVEERLVERDRLDERRERAEDLHDRAARRRGTRRTAARGTRRPDTRGAPAPSASPSARRSGAPRSSRPRPRRAGRGRRRSPAFPRATGSSSCSTDA